MKRPGACLDCLAKRPCQQQQEASASAQQEECSSAPARKFLPLLMQKPMTQPLFPQLVAVKQHLQVPAFVVSQPIGSRLLAD